MNSGLPSVIRSAAVAAASSACSSPSSFIAAAIPRVSFQPSPASSTWEAAGPSRRPAIAAALSSVGSTSVGR